MKTDLSGRVIDIVEDISRNEFGNLKDIIKDEKNTTSSCVCDSKNAEVTGKDDSEPEYPHVLTLFGIAMPSTSYSDTSYELSWLDMIIFIVSMGF